MRARAHLEASPTGYRSDRSGHGDQLAGGAKPLEISAAKEDFEVRRPRRAFFVNLDLERVEIEVMRLLALICSCALLLSCGGTQQSSLRRKVAQAQATHEFPAPPPPAETVTGGSPSAIAAIRAFVTAYINWNAQTVSQDMQSLAARSVGQARSALQLAAAQTAGDYELKQGGIANSGTVEAVAPLPGRGDQYVVVTRELTTASNTTLYQGLGAAWHVAIATVRQVRAGVWALSGWQPEN